MDIRGRGSGVGEREKKNIESGDDDFF